MIICYSEMFVVQHLEKTGGTTVEHSIAPYLQLGDLLINDWTKLFFGRENYELSEHAPAWVIAKYLGDAWGGMRTFSTVRNPVEIMQSFYKYSKSVYEEHFAGTNEVVMDSSLKAYLYSEKTGYGPSGFVDYMFARGFNSVTPQIDRLGDIAKNGYVVDLSMLDKEWGSVTEYLHLETIPMLRRNVLRSGGVIFSDDTVKRIKKHFEADYDMLPSITGVQWS